MGADEAVIDKRSGLYLPQELARQRRTERRELTMRLQDRYVNNINKFGAQGYDPQTETHYVPETPPSLQDLDNLVRYNWLARRMISAMPRAATREGFEPRSDNDSIDNKLKEVKQLLDEWKVLNYLRDGGTMANGYGMSYLVRRYNDGGMQEQFAADHSMVRGLARIHVVDHIHCQPAAFYNRPWDRRMHKEPMLYHVSIPRPKTRTWENGYFHENRINCIEADFLPDRLKTHNLGAPDSILVPAIEALKIHGTTIQAVAALIQDYVIKVLKVNNLEEMLDEENPDGPEQLEKVTAAANAELSIGRMALIDSESDYKKISTTIAGLPDIVVISFDHVSAVIDIPKSLLFGNLTGTLGSSSGYHDRTNFYERAEFYQKHTMTPALWPFVTLACRLCGIDPTKVKIAWNKIRDEGDKEAAEIEKLVAEARKINAEAEAMERKLKENKNLDEAA